MHTTIGSEDARRHGVSKEHLELTLRYVSRGIKELRRIRPDCLVGLDPELFVGQGRVHPEEIVLGTALARHRLYGKQRDDLVDLGFRPIRATDEYYAFLGLAWKDAVFAAQGRPQFQLVHPREAEPPAAVA